METNNFALKTMSTTSWKVKTYFCNQRADWVCIYFSHQYKAVGSAICGMTQNFSEASLLFLQPGAKPARQLQTWLPFQRADPNIQASTTENLSVLRAAAGQHEITICNEEGNAKAKIMWCAGTKRWRLCMANCPLSSIFQAWYQSMILSKTGSAQSCGFCCFSAILVSSGTFLLKRT